MKTIKLRLEDSFHSQLKIAAVEGGITLEKYCLSLLGADPAYLDDEERLDLDELLQDDKVKQALELIQEQNED